jgi:hypothetical protein
VLKTMGATTCHGHQRPERMNHRDNGAESRPEAALEGARCAGADQLTHEEPEIECANVDQQSLQNVRVAAEVYAAHSAGFIDVGEGTFQALAAEPQ